MFDFTSQENEARQDYALRFQEVSAKSAADIKRVLTEKQMLNTGPKPILVAR
jgi:hypothetical protein